MRPIYVVFVLPIASTQFRVNKPTFCSPVEKESGVSRFESRITESTEDPLDYKKARDQDGWMKYNVFQRVSAWKSTGIIQTFMTRKTVISQRWQSMWAWYNMIRNSFSFQYFVESIKYWKYIDANHKQLNIHIYIHLFYMFCLYIYMIGNFIHLFKSAWKRHVHINIYAWNIQHKNLAMFVSIRDIYVIRFDICIFSCNNPGKKIYSFSASLPPIL